jgi:hypothetical protein
VRGVLFAHARAPAQGQPVNKSTFRPNFRRQHTRNRRNRQHYQRQQIRGPIDQQVLRAMTAASQTKNTCQIAPEVACLTSAWMVVEFKPREAAAEAAAAEFVIRTQAGAPAQCWVSQRTSRSTAASLCRRSESGMREEEEGGGGGERGGGGGRGGGERGGGGGRGGGRRPAVTGRGLGKVRLAMVLVRKHVKSNSCVLRDG